MYVKTVNNTVTAYPYTMADLKADYPNVSFPRPLPTARLEEHGIFEVVEGEKPAFNAATEKLVLAETPVNLSGVWTLVYSVVAKTQEELDEETARELSLSERDGAKLFFRLCRVLIDKGVFSPTENDPDIIAIKNAYLKWKSLRNE